MNNLKKIKLTLFSLLLLTTGGLQAQGLSKTAQSMAKQGFVNIKDVDKSIEVSLMYSRADNFTGKVLYTDLREAYLYPTAAQALKKAQAALKKMHPGWSLKIYDAARPMHIQQKMWNVVAGTNKDIYVSNPKNGGGLHNYGLAVDITICNEKGDTIDMGTKVDHLGREAHVDIEEQLVKEKKISRRAVNNRKLLRQVMAAGGFKVLRTEWWHFNFKTRKEAKAHYKVIK